MTRLAVNFTNLGPYHRARLRAAALALAARGGALTAIETAGSERKYAWNSETCESGEPYEHVTLAPDTALESLSPAACRAAMRKALDDLDPDAVAVAGYVRPEVMAATDWARRRDRPIILMSESQAIDRPRVWWKESIKRRRVARFDAALCGGPEHRDYLVELGMPADRIALGYNAVDHDAFAARADAARAVDRPPLLPTPPFFLCVCRFAPEKDIFTLLDAFARHRANADPATSWGLALVGDGPDRAAIDRLIDGLGLRAHVALPGFLQAEALAPWHAHAGAFVLPSRSEPWGLVVNEAAAARLPLIVSDRCGCASTLVPDPPGTTGWTFPAGDAAALADRLDHFTRIDSSHRIEIGARAHAIASAWGPSRFADGLLEALDRASDATRSRRPARVSTPPRF
jgi:glycosyltransferase involved in cell wall biosynthesis